MKIVVAAILLLIGLMGVFYLIGMTVENAVLSALTEFYSQRLP